MNSIQLHLLFALALFCLAQSATIIKYSQASPELLGFWRLIVAALLIWLWRGIHLKTLRLEGNRQTLWAGFFFFIHLWPFAWAAQMTSVAHCMLLFSLHPLSTALLLAIKDKEKPSPQVLYAGFFAFVGLLLVLTPGAQSQTTIQGDLLAFGSGILYSFYAYTAKKARIQFGNSQFMVVAYTIAAVFFAGTALAKGETLWPQTPTAWISIGGLVLIPTLAGHGLYSYLMQYLNLNWMSAGKLIEPLISSVVALWIFGEKLTLLSALALACAFFAGALLVRDQSKSSS